MNFSGEQSHAGAYAQVRYEHGLRRFRSRLRPIFAAIFGPFILAGLLGFALAPNRLLTWCAGVAFGLGAGIWMVMRDSPPAYIENWQLGAEGERKTAKALAALKPPRWLVVHDIKARYGNYDHILVSRAGVFLLETKNLQGIIELEGHTPHLRRRLDPDANTTLNTIRPAALRDAARLSAEIQRRTGRTLWVQAVVVLWSDFPQRLIEDDNCVFIHGPQLRTWISQRQDRLDANRTQAITAAVEAIAADGHAQDAT